METLSFSLASYSVLLSVPIDRFFLLENYFTSVPDFNQPLSNYRKKKKKTQSVFSLKTASLFQKSDLPTTRNIFAGAKRLPKWKEDSGFAEKETRRIYLSSLRDIFTKNESFSRKGATRHGAMAEGVCSRTVLTLMKRSQWRGSVVVAWPGHTRRHVLATRGLSYAKGNGRGLPG